MYHNIYIFIGITKCFVPRPSNSLTFKGSWIPNPSSVPSESLPAVRISIDRGERNRGYGWGLGVIGYLGLA